ncbi:hypothetical protein D3C86_1953240 [compost metagenome]
MFFVFQTIGFQNAVEGFLYSLPVAALVLHLQRLDLVIVIHKIYGMPLFEVVQNLVEGSIGRLLAALELRDLPAGERLGIGHRTANT